MDNLTFGQRLVSFRTKKQLLQKELAEKIGVSATALNYYEKDKTEPNVLTIAALAQALGVTGNDLLGINDSIIYLSEDELQVIDAYRKNLDMQSAVDKLLGLPPRGRPPIEDANVRVFKAAKSKEKTPPGYTDMPKSILDRLKKAKGVSSDDEI